MASRGGPQRIPRPEDWQLGKPAPWAHLDGFDLGLDSIERTLSQRPAGDRGSVETDRRSAVLVPLYEDGGETWVVLTRRSPTMRSHTHEVSFPGGRQDADDIDEWDTALREAHEEVALDRTLPRRIGELDRFITKGSESLIHPLVAALPARPALAANESEVEHILHVPLAELLLPDVFREELWRWPGAPHPRPITFFELVGDTVWGATGAMLRQLLSIVAGVEDGLTY